MWIVTGDSHLSRSVISGYLFLYLIDEFDASKLLLGLTILMTILGEAPFFYVSPWLLSKIGGTDSAYKKSVELWFSHT